LKVSYYRFRGLQNRSLTHIAPFQGKISGPKSTWDRPIDLHAFTLPENQNAMRLALRKGGVLLNDYRALTNQYGAGFSAAAALMQQKTLAEEAWAKLLQIGQKLELEQAAGLLADLGMPPKDLAAIKMAPQPDGMVTKMLPYQRQGLFWMLQAEHPHGELLNL
jgi:SWI/SNF-related matrix-associated actin-dependent regulator of chromatin subfamily A3